MLFATTAWSLPTNLVMISVMETEMDETHRALRRLGEVVRARRESMGLRQDELAEYGGPSTTTLTKIENGSPPAPTAATLRKLDAGLAWEFGSSERVLAGGSPFVSHTRRTRDGKLIAHVYAVGDSDQHELEQVRLASLIADVRDLLQKQDSTPESRMISTLLDEAFELSIRAIVRDNEYDLTEENFEFRRQSVEEQRATKQIRRRGSIYVVDDPVSPSRQSDYELAAAGRTTGSRSRGQQLREQQDADGEQG